MVKIPTKIAYAVEVMEMGTGSTHSGYFPYSNFLLHSFIAMAHNREEVEGEIRFSFIYAEWKGVKSCWKMDTIPRLPRTANAIQAIIHSEMYDFYGKCSPYEHAPYPVDLGISTRDMEMILTALNVPKFNNNDIYVWGSGNSRGP